MIPNGADLDLFSPGEKENYVRKELGLTGKFVVGYFGAHGRANHLTQLLDVADKIKDSHPDVQIMLVGGGMLKKGLVEEAEKRQLHNITFVDPVSKEKIADYINATDVSTAVLMKNDTFKTVYPNKVFDYMCCAKPILIGIDGVARKLVEDAGAGLFVEPENVDAFIAGIEKLKNDPQQMKDMGESGRKYVEVNFDRRNLAKKYLEVLRKVVS